MIAPFLDENLASNSVARQLRMAGHTVFLPQELGLIKADDSIILAAAQSRLAVLITNNSHDFVDLHHERERTGVPHQGIILALRTDPTLVQGLLRGANLLNPDNAVNQLMYLDYFDSDELAQNFGISITPR